MRGWGQAPIPQAGDSAPRTPRTRREAEGATCVAPSGGSVGGWAVKGMGSIFSTVEQAQPPKKSPPRACGAPLTAPTPGAPIPDTAKGNPRRRGSPRFRRRLSDLESRIDHFGICLAGCKVSRQIYPLSTVYHKAVEKSNKGSVLFKNFKY